MRSGIPTTYASSRFRSRLEARWAAFFDLLGWQWIYEPFDAEGYIPDFLVKGERPLLVEVKPAIWPADYEQPVERISRALRHAWPDGDVLIVGADPLPTLDSISDAPMAGLLGEARSWPDRERSWAPGLWATCLECGELAVYHLEQSYACRPCGHYDGDHFLGPVSEEKLGHRWNEAGNAVQWKRPA